MSLLSRVSSNLNHGPLYQIDYQGPSEQLSQISFEEQQKMLLPEIRTFFPILDQRSIEWLSEEEKLAILEAMISPDALHGVDPKQFVNLFSECLKHGVESIGRNILNHKSLTPDALIRCFINIGICEFSCDFEQETFDHTKNTVLANLRQHSRFAEIELEHLLEWFQFGLVTHESSLLTAIANHFYFAEPETMQWLVRHAGVVISKDIKGRICLKNFMQHLSELRFSKESRSRVVQELIISSNTKEQWSRLEKQGAQALFMLPDFFVSKEHYNEVVQDLVSNQSVDFAKYFSTHPYFVISSFLLPQVVKSILSNGKTEDANELLASPTFLLDVRLRIVREALLVEDADFIDSLLNLSNIVLSQKDYNVLFCFLMMQDPEKCVEHFKSLLNHPYFVLEYETRIDILKQLLSQNYKDQVNAILAFSGYFNTSLDEYKFLLKELFVTGELNLANDFLGLSNFVVLSEECALVLNDLKKVGYARLVDAFCNLPNFKILPNAAEILLKMRKNAVSTPRYLE